MYMAEKKAYISDIRHQLLTPNLLYEQQYEINNRLYEQYCFFMIDSAIMYKRRNLEIAIKIEDDIKKQESDIQLASLYVVAGLYVEANKILESYKASDFNEDIRVEYYEAYRNWYNNYARSSNLNTFYDKVSKEYQDSILSILDPSSDKYIFYLSEMQLFNNNLAAAKKQLLKLLDNDKTEKRIAAMACFAIAKICEEENNISDAQKYYAISGIYDIIGNVKENMATRALATLLFAQGDIKNAYICIKSSMEDALFCNARLRTHEVSTILPIIDTAYREKINNEKTLLKYLLWLTSFFAAILAVAFFYLYKHTKRTNEMRKQLKLTNEELEELNNNLNETISQLNRANKDLSGANKIKEMYIAQFLDLCSNYIIKLDKYQNTLNKKANAKQFDELYKILRSKDMINEELTELYRTFDYVFLHLYPNFIEKFNELLTDDARFSINVNNQLNIELRIFALIRLGITDSSKIARFLHYSANTIYNYRTRIKNKSAGERDKFEERVMLIENEDNIASDFGSL